MKQLLIVSFIAMLFGCSSGNENQRKEKNKELAVLFDNYFEERLKLFPLEATAIGDPRYNNLLPVDFTDGYRDTLKIFYNHYLGLVNKFDREKLNDIDKINFDVFKREMEINLEGLKYPENLIPFQQFVGLPLTMGNWAAPREISLLKR
jgi:uncharacterized protein (DUF885 family)